MKKKGMLALAFRSLSSLIAADRPIAQALLREGKGFSGGNEGQARRIGDFAPRYYLKDK